MEGTCYVLLCVVVVLSSRRAHTHTHTHTHGGGCVCHILMCVAGGSSLVACLTASVLSEGVNASLMFVRSEWTNLCVAYFSVIAVSGGRFGRGEGRGFSPVSPCIDSQHAPVSTSYHVPGASAFILSACPLVVVSGPNEL